MPCRLVLLQLRPVEKLLWGSTAEHQDIIHLGGRKPLPPEAFAEAPPFLYNRSEGSDPSPCRHHDKWCDQLRRLHPQLVLHGSAFLHPLDPRDLQGAFLNGEEELVRMGRCTHLLEVGCAYTDPPHLGTRDVVDHRQSDGGSMRSNAGRGRDGELARAQGGDHVKEVRERRTGIGEVPEDLQESPPLLLAVFVEIVSPGHAAELLDPLLLCLIGSKVE
mmetsp:Transcript_13598/g.47230  ORF Transcript_13598/g.47230 Transcript_13598/m.47230 type:complete len:218 (-) Transcript_13598:1024-1677(-)